MAIAVTDPGFGVPQEALSRVFDPFYQLDPSRAGRETAPGRRGAGLRLAVVQECRRMVVELVFAVRLGVGQPL
jgi:signal transduction histidine kinase